MFDIGWSEFVLIGIVALIAIGPKELPGALRTLGQWMGKLRRMASEFQGQFQEAMREAEMADLKKQVDEMTAQAQSYANLDPISDVRRELETTQQQIESAVAAPQPAPAPSEPAGQAPASPEPPVDAAQPPIPDMTTHPASPASEPADARGGAPAQEAGGKPA
jgi:sec-independent protein translocase protein TatB